MINIAIVGGSGYTGGELVRILMGHNGVRLAAVTSRRLESKFLSKAMPWLEGHTDMRFSPLESVLQDGHIDLVFTALGHTESLAVVPEILDSGKKVVDLSADFRFQDPHVYETVYLKKHSRPDLLERAVYGLPELNRRDISKSFLVANPGCYATAAILALLPLASKNMLPLEGIIVDAKSGVSGSGRTPKDQNIFTECHEGLRPYAVEGHRHQPEIESSLGRACDSKVSITFIPHLIPANRGILATVYLEKKLPIEEVREIYRSFYHGEPFIKVNPAGCIPGIQDVRGSNFCRIGLEESANSRHLIIFAALDNLVKGASGQAVQNMNIMMGIEEHHGLGQLALWP